MQKNNMISDWLDKHGDLEIEESMAKSMAITEEVRVVLETKGWQKGQLAEAIGKKPTVVSEWLSGMHKHMLKLHC